MTFMKRQHCRVSLQKTIFETVQLIEQAGINGGEPGIAVVLDSGDQVLGVVTDGDIREAICKQVDFNQPVQTIMSSQPIVAKDNLNPSQTLRVVTQQMREKNTVAGKVIIVDQSNRFVDITSLHSLYQEEDISFRRVAVYGMGFVGLTLALTLAENNLFDVIGIDIKQEVVEDLKRNIPPFFENGLHSLLEQVHAQNGIQFTTNETPIDAEIHIISVGTPVDKEKAVMTYLEFAGKDIGKVLKKNDLVICRSTVPVGTTRTYLIPILEQYSGLTAGREFFVAFAPERTVEGNALKELRSLPQVIGGLTPKCTKLASSVFQKITQTLVRVSSLEAAEVVKLINNTFRDVVFSFANEVSFLCDQYNLNAFDVIAAANEGYPRNPIPNPSPGVGGICLAKDPILYCQHEKEGFLSITMGKISRNINQKGAEYTVWQYSKFLQQNEITTPRVVFIIGLAFKGVPDTSDIRYSSGMDLVKILKKRGDTVVAYDGVLSSNEIKELGIEPVTLQEGMVNSDAVFVMNNHPLNTKFELYEGLSSLKKPSLFFDGWGLFTPQDIESVKGVTYATMGYITP
jgi:UDP-N-acetyl-D-mannosaminuronic acid dehydrogenase